MRIRTIKPDFWSHEKMSALPAETALLALGLLNYADDEGFFNANPKLVLASLFPLRELSRNVPGMLQELSGVEYLALRRLSDGREIGRVVNFGEHQYISHPKKSVLRSLFEDAGKLTGSLPEASGNSQSGMEGNGREQGTGKGTGNARARGARGGKPRGMNPADMDPGIRSRVEAIGDLLGRVPATIWTTEEYDAFMAAGLDQSIDADFQAQLGTMRPLYAATLPRGKDFRRRDVLRLLQNWPGELDKARAFNREQDDGLKKL